MGAITCVVRKNIAQLASESREAVRAGLKQSVMMSLIGPELIVYVTGCGLISLSSKVTPTEILRKRTFVWFCAAKYVSH